MNAANYRLVQRLLTILVFSFCSFTQADDLTELKAFNGDGIVIKKEALTHLVFMDAWSIYGGSGDDTLVHQLPANFLQHSQQIWIQPAMNVTLAQLEEFQGYFPKVSPLVLDQGFKLMRGFGIWNSPHHVLLQDDKAIFSGSNEELQAYTKRHFSSDPSLALWRKSSQPKVSTALAAKSVETVEFSKTTSRYQKPVVGSKAPSVIATTLSGGKISARSLLQDKPVTLVFVDALCPMPQLPGCEAKLASLNEKIATDDSRHWVGVISSYYVSEDVARVFTDKFKLALPLIFDTDNKIFKAFDVHATPYVIDLSSDGLIASRGDLHI